jgi:hypothetical protein
MDLIPCKLLAFEVRRGAETGTEQADMYFEKQEPGSQLCEFAVKQSFSKVTWLMR